ncbi:MAG: conjugal transfer protein TraR [Sphingomonas pseudosanguinis]|uniref:conjugal transfer protein TraR n=1 Tax=Sphingomonas pseudosanguinis TaxID=413712 RepID=UPI003919B468
MSDAADLANDILERAMANRAPSPPLAPGVAGECDDCGRASPRLIGGRCAPCRDRRR